MQAASRPLALLALVALCACGHDWDSLDPRLNATGGASSAAGGASGSGASDAGGAPTGGASASASSSASASATTAGPGGGGSGGAPVLPFLDDFDRPDAEDLGNGWIEKQPLVFSIGGGEVTRVASSTSYRDDMCYRPASEDALDVEVSIEVRFIDIDLGYPQVFVRAQAATLATPDIYDGYIMYFDGAGTDTLVVGRQHGSVFVVTLTFITLPEPVTLVDRYRFSLRAEGTDPAVQVRGRVEKLDGNAWTVIGEASADDIDPTRVVAPGSVGFSGAETDSFVYDNFTRTLLAP